jgi:hypothetical protein
MHKCLNGPGSSWIGTAKAWPSNGIATGIHSSKLLSNRLYIFRAKVELKHIWLKLSYYLGDFPCYKDNEVCCFVSCEGGEASREVCKYSPSAQQLSDCDTFPMWHHRRVVKVNTFPKTFCNFIYQFPFHLSCWVLSTSVRRTSLNSNICRYHQDKCICYYKYARGVSLYNLVLRSILFTSRGQWKHDLIMV